VHCKNCDQDGHYAISCKSRIQRPIKKVSIKKTKPKKPKAHTRGWYIKKLDAVYSQYIRQMYADKNGMIKCSTCPDIKHIKEMQNGHYESRGHYPTRWYDKNCHPQCYKCNCILRGNYTVYAIFMINKYGDGILEQLRYLTTTQRKYTLCEIKELIDFYTLELKL